MGSVQHGTAQHPSNDSSCWMGFGEPLPTHPNCLVDGSTMVSFQIVQPIHLLDGLVAKPHGKHGVNSLVDADPLRQKSPFEKI